MFIWLGKCFTAINPSLLLYELGKYGAKTNELQCL